MAAAAPGRPMLPAIPVYARGLPAFGALWDAAQNHGAQLARHARAVQTAQALMLPLRKGGSAKPPNGVHPAAQALSLSAAQVMPQSHIGPPIEAHQVLRAIERQDIVLLSALRDHNLRLLLRPIGGVTPLVYAMRLGPKHEGLGIVLVGFFSRFVNQLDDAALASRTTQATLRLVRTNLRVAISFGIQNRCTALLASYLQVIVMSEGEQWIAQSTQTIAQTIAAGSTPRALQFASACVAQWVREELASQADDLAIADYVYNATTDLFLMGCLAARCDSARLIAPHCFGRDDRVLGEFRSILMQLTYDGQAPRRPRLERLCDEVAAILGDRCVGHAAKMQGLATL